MRKYVQATAQLWEAFQASHQEDAAEIRALVLDICSDMTSVERKKQVDSMLASGQFGKLREMLVKHDKALGIRNHTDTELALWIRTICFCNLMKQEHAQ